MNPNKSILSILLLFLSVSVLYGQKRNLTIGKTSAKLTIDGILNEDVWKTAVVADSFVELRPTPFKPESPANPTKLYLLYSNDGIYIGGYMHELSTDSIAKELVGRDGFGNNDFVGVVFDTYYDKLNGFEYFVTPLGEQWDAKVSPSNGEDFSWNAVWESKSVMQKDGWSFEMFLPYSAIRFGNKKQQIWGLNFVRRRQKSGQQLFWQPIDPTKNGFLTQEGTLTGLENIKPPLRLQFSPYMSFYQNHDGTGGPGVKKNETVFNGGMDLKYGISPAFTLDMTLIPDFGQVQTDNRFLNLSPFEQRFSENRAFFTEGTELFSKGNLFYSRRIGVDPRYSKRIEIGANDSIVKYPTQSKILNATKISGRTQKGLGIGILNAVTEEQFATIENRSTGERYRLMNMPLTNYNILVLDQTLQNNSSVSLVNTNVWRSGSDYDANVTSVLFDLNNRKNIWNIGGNVSTSNRYGQGLKNVTGYAHSFYMGKSSGRLVGNIWQDLSNADYDKSDLGFFTNNNFMDQGTWWQYNWNKPKSWYNAIHINFNFWYSRLVTPIDPAKRPSLMYQNSGFNFNGDAQTKKLQSVGFLIKHDFRNNDFYEPRYRGKFYHSPGSYALNLWYESNASKKYSFNTSVFFSDGGVFGRFSQQYSVGGKARFSSKFSVDYSLGATQTSNEAGWAGFQQIGGNDVIYFSRRDLHSVENILYLKYNFTNRMGLSLRGRHSWTKVNPKQFYELNYNGDLVKPDVPFTENVRQNYNFVSLDAVYTWQFAQGSFLNIVWKDAGEDFNRSFERNYSKNLERIIKADQYNSFSVKLIYFIDYLNVKRRLSKKKTA